MYSEQLEQLIKSVIVDGVITDKERAVLHKKAAAEGVDEDEIDVYVDGLVTQKKSEARDSSKTKKILKVNFNYVNKQVSYDGKTSYYLGKDYYEINIAQNKFLTKIYLNFFKEEKKEGIRYGIFVIFESKKGVDLIFNFPNMTIKTDRNSFNFEKSRSDIIIPSSIIDRSSITDRDDQLKLISYACDEEIIKLLCDAKEISLSFYNCKGRIKNWLSKEHYEKQFDIEDISISAFKNNAKIFYGAVFNYVVQEDKCEASNEDVFIANMLIKDTRFHQKCIEKSPVWDKYLGWVSDTIYHMKDSMSFIGFSSERTYKFELHFHAYENRDHKVKYFLELICTCKNKEDNNGKLPKIPFDLTEGELQINVEGNDSLFIPFVKDMLSLSSHQKTLNGDEHCLYEVPSALMESIVDRKKIKLKAFGSENKSAKLRRFGIFFENKMPKKWELAYKLIAHPDKKEQYLEEYHNYLLGTKVCHYAKEMFNKFLNK